jgi:hypothetical protein
VTGDAKPKGTGHSLSIYNDKLLIGSLWYGTGDRAGLEYYSGGDSITTFIDNKNSNAKYGQSVTLYENIALVSDNANVYYYTISENDLGVPQANPVSNNNITRSAMEQELTNLGIVFTYITHRKCCCNRTSRN